LGGGEPLLGNVDGGAAKVRRGDIAVRGRGVAVDAHQVALILDGPDGRVYLQAATETGGMGACQVDEESGGPGPGITAVHGQRLIDAKLNADRERDESLLAAELVELGVVF